MQCAFRYAILATKRLLWEIIWSNSFSMWARVVWWGLFFEDNQLPIAAAAFELQAMVYKPWATCQLVQDQASVLQPMDVPTPPSTLIGTQPVTTTDNFTYLGSTIASNNSSFNDVNRRIAIATSTMSKLSSLWTSSRLSLALKMRLYNSLIISIITYSSASWTLTKAQKKRLDAFNTKALRRIVGVRWHDYVTNASDDSGEGGDNEECDGSESVNGEEGGSSEECGCSEEARNSEEGDGSEEGWGIISTWSHMLCI